MGTWGPRLLLIIKTPPLLLPLPPFLFSFFSLLSPILNPMVIEFLVCDHPLEHVSLTERHAFKEYLLFSQQLSVTKTSSSSVETNSLFYVGILFGLSWLGLMPSASDGSS